MRIEIPYVQGISVNHIYIRARNRRRGRKVIKLKGAQVFQRTIASLFLPLRRQFKDEGYKRVKIWYYFPDRRRRDTHNLLKVVLDGISEGIGIDDRWFLVEEKGVWIDPKKPRIEIEVVEDDKSGP